MRSPTLHSRCECRPGVVGPTCNPNGTTKVSTADKLVRDSQYGQLRRDTYLSKESIHNQVQEATKELIADEYSRE